MLHVSIFSSSSLLSATYSGHVIILKWSEGFELLGTNLDSLLLCVGVGGVGAKSGERRRGRMRSVQWLSHSQSSLKRMKFHLASLLCCYWTVVYTEPSPSETKHCFLLSGHLLFKAAAFQRGKCWVFPDRFVDFSTLPWTFLISCSQADILCLGLGKLWNALKATLIGGEIGTWTQHFWALNCDMWICLAGHTLVALQMMYFNYLFSIYSFIFVF